VSSILLASADDSLRETVSSVLAAEGIAHLSVADWPTTCARTCGATTRLVLVDAELPSLDAELLARLAASLRNGPTVRVVRGTAQPLTALSGGDRGLLRLAREATPREALDPFQRRLLRHAGFGSAPTTLLARLASSPLPVLLHGERGTGKARVARALHALRGIGQPLVEGGDGRWEPHGSPGAVYLPAAHLQDPAALRAGIAAGWRIVAGARSEDPLPGVPFVRLALPPLRDRPDDLRALTLAYLEHHAAQLGLPRRRLDRGMWTLVHAHPWPDNQRELEQFVLDLLATVHDPVIRVASLPPAVRSRLEPHAAVTPDLGSFEEVVRARLATVVERWEPGPGPALYDHVVDGVDRALLPLVLLRTEGNRKRAAALLGMARNTLQARIERLGLAARGNGTAD
jgi:DNA-binding NtrC family response regulator